LATPHLAAVQLEFNPGEQQVSKSVKPDNLEGFSGGITNIFGGFDKGISGWLEESQDGEGEVGEGGEDFTKTWAAEVMAVFVPPAQQSVPPTVFDDVQRVLDLPMIANKFFKFGRCDIRRIETRDEVTRVVRKKRTIMVDHLAIDTHNDLTIRDGCCAFNKIGACSVSSR